MNVLFREHLASFGFAATIFAGCLVHANQCPAADTPQGSVAGKAGDAIYLTEPEQVVAPTFVTKDTIREKYDNDKPKLEREVARYSDNHFEAEGAYREFYPNGQMFVEGQFHKGRQEGEWTYWFENGKQNRKVTYKDGKLNGSWDATRADGTIATKRGFKDGLRDGDWINYDDTGKNVITEEHYKSGKEDGVWKTSFPDGKPKWQMEFKDGKLNGKRTDWDEKGQPRLEVTYVDGKPDGTLTRYFADGRKLVQVYKQGRLESETVQ